jgi:hypothetical protein
LRASLSKISSELVGCNLPKGSEKMGHDIHVRAEYSSFWHKYHAIALDRRTGKKAEAWGKTEDEARANAIANLQDKLASGR